MFNPRLFVLRLVITCFTIVLPIASKCQLQFDKISIEHGLSQSSVYNIYQDKEGFMWFATGDGINRYDGKDFISYKSRFGDTGAAHPRQRNINSNIVEDRYNRLWANCDAGIFYMNKKYGSFKMVVPFNIIRYAPHIDFADEYDTLWISLDYFGIAIIDTKSLQYHSYKADTTSKLMQVMNTVNTPKGIYIADTKGIVFFDKRTHTFSRILKLEGTECIKQLHDGRLIIGGINCAYLYDLQTGKCEKILTKDNTKNYYWRYVAEHAPTNAIYFGSYANSALCALNINTKEYKIYNWQKSNIASLTIDRSENLWVGTDGGGAYKANLKPEKFHCYPQKQHTNDLSDSGWMVKSIYCDGSGKIWIGSFNKGLVIYDPKNKTREQVPLGDFTYGTIPQVSFISKDSSGDMIVTAFNNILWVDAITRKIKKRIEISSTYTPNMGSPNINCLYEWEKGHYIGCSNERLFTITTNAKGALEARYFQHVFSWQYKIQRIKDGTYYIGSREGYQHIRMTSDTTIQILEQDLYDIGIRQFYESAQHPYLFMAGETGLIVKNKKTGKYSVYDERNGLENSYIYSILPESDTSLWISTNAGISNARIKYDDDSLHARFINFGTKDGLQSNEFNTGAYYQATDGTLFFGGIYGINWFNPRTLHLNPYKALPVITSIEINDTLFIKDTASYVRKIELPWSENTISLSFKALEFTDPSGNSFAYTLQGFDKRWVYNQAGKARYTNLPPGNYTFLLKAANNDGVWNEQPLQISIIIHPPYWRTWWFRFLIIILIATLIYLLNRYYVRQKIREKTLLLDKQRALYEERLRISKDVHDDLGSGLSKITLMAETAKQHMHQSGNESIEHISQISKDLIGNMRDLIWVLNPENTTLDNLAARIREYGSEYLEGLPVQFTAKIPEQLPTIQISRDAQRNIFLTVKEAIHNCVKHANAAEITISILVENGILSLQIIDNGNGFIHSITNGNGLRNMKLRIEKTGGVFNLSSLQGQGTTIHISIPIASLVVTDRGNNTFV